MTTPTQNQLPAALQVPEPLRPVQAPDRLHAWNSAEQQSAAARNRADRDARAQAEALKRRMAERGKR